MGNKPRKRELNVRHKSDGENYVFAYFFITLKEQFLPNGALGAEGYQFTKDRKVLSTEPNQT